MIRLTIESAEWFNQETETFEYTSSGTFEFEHSLRTIALWESHWKIPYLSNVANFTIEQERSYYMFMCQTDGFDERMLTASVVNQLVGYIKDPHTATTIQNDSSKGRGKVVTNEVIYAMMAAGHIPFECDRWHFNRLLTLIAVVSEQHAPKKKMSQQEILQQNARLNAERKKQLNTKG